MLNKNANAIKFTLRISRFYTDISIIAKYHEASSQYVVCALEHGKAKPLLVAKLGTLSTDESLLACIRSLHDLGFPFSIEITKRTRPSAKPVYTILASRSGMLRRCSQATAELFLNDAWDAERTVMITHSDTPALIAFNDKQEHFHLRSVNNA